MEDVTAVERITREKKREEDEERVRDKVDGKGRVCKIHMSLFDESQGGGENRKRKEGACSMSVRLDSCWSQ